MVEEATVVAFRPVASRFRREPREDRDDTERGTILLFTGVRYERMVDEPVKSTEHHARPDRSDEIWA
jgi:hypothetical protein